MDPREVRFSSAAYHGYSTHRRNTDFVNRIFLRCEFLGGGLLTELKLKQVSRRLARYIGWLAPS